MLIKIRFLSAFIAIVSISSFIFCGCIFNISANAANNETFDKTEKPADLDIYKIKQYKTDYAAMLSVFQDGTKKTPEGWRQADLDNDGIEDIYKNNKTGFEAAVFTVNNTAVIVIRGMNFRYASAFNVFSGEDGKNARDIFWGNSGIPFLKRIPDQFYDGLAFYDRVKNKFPDYKIIIVGKSLGGAVAEMIGAVKGDETYTFAAPGMHYTLSKLQDEFKEEIKKNGRSNFSYIKNYYNINDPCGNYGKHIGLSFVYPPVPIKNSGIYDVHGNIDHFASKDAVNKMIPLPKQWKYKYTAALVYYDNNFKDEVKPLSLHGFLKFRYSPDKNDLEKAREIVNRFFNKNNQRYCNKQAEING
jgi:hypothetical protein